MMKRWTTSALVAATLFTVGLPAQQAPALPAALATAIDQLGSFDFPTRTEAARTLRRAPAATVAPALAAAVRAHRDEFVRFRALVLLTGMDETLTREVVRSAATDRNDRLRTVAFSWLEQHPDPALLTALIGALAKERSEFVRPALTRAVAALGTDARAQAVLVPLVVRGEDLFRGATISALGDHGGKYAIAEILEVAKLDGPLTDDAITALGKLGDATLRPTLAALQRTAEPELQPTISGALCLLGIECDSQFAYLRKTLGFAAGNETFQPLLRGVVHGLGMLAIAGRDDALGALLDSGVPARDPARSPIALAVGQIGIRNPVLFLRVLEARKDRDGAIELMRDAFDMLGEDYQEERFYVEIRKAGLAAPAGSPRRQVAQTLVDKLEF
jgi:hypothetical protein